MRKNMRNYAKMCESHNSPPPCHAPPHYGGHAQPMLAGPKGGGSPGDNLLVAIPHTHPTAGHFSNYAPHPPTVSSAKANAPDPRKCLREKGA